MSTSEKLHQKQEQLKKLIPKKLNQAILQLKNDLSPRSESYNILINLEAHYQEQENKSMHGELSLEELDIQNNRIRKRLLNLIDSLEPTDLESKKETIISAFPGLAILYAIVAIAFIASVLFFSGVLSGPVPSKDKVENLLRQLKDNAMPYAEKKRVKSELLDLFDQEMIILIKGQNSTIVREVGIKEFLDKYAGQFKDTVLEKITDKEMVFKYQ